MHVLLVNILAIFCICACVAKGVDIASVFTILRNVTSRFDMLSQSMLFVCCFNLAYI